MEHWLNSSSARKEIRIRFMYLPPAQKTRLTTWSVIRQPGLVGEAHVPRTLQDFSGFLTVVQFRIEQVKILLCRGK
jgi:hypothetical protein